MLVAPRIGMLDMPDRFYAGEMFPIARTVTAKDNHDVAGVIPRAPKPVVLMITNGLGQTVTRPEEIDRAGFAVIVREDCHSRSVRFRQTAEHATNLTSHFFPSELVSKVLRQWPG